MRLRVFVRSQKGFSLLETVIAIGVLGIIAPALVFALATGVNVLSMTDLRETARDLAQSQMESVQRQPYDPNLGNDPPYALVERPAGFEVVMTATRIDQGGGTTNDTGIQHIEILIMRGDKTIFVLDGQKVKW